MKELISYSQVGVLLYLQGKPSNPAKIAKACQVSESKATYMREYLPDEKGQIRGINFERVRMP